MLCLFMRIVVNCLREGGDPCWSRRGVLFPHDPSAPWPDECYDIQAITNHVGTHVTRNLGAFGVNWKIGSHGGSLLPQSTSSTQHMMDRQNCSWSRVGKASLSWRVAAADADCHLKETRSSADVILAFLEKEMQTAFQEKYMYTQRTFEVLELFGAKPQWNKAVPRQLAAILGCLDV